MFWFYLVSSFILVAFGQPIWFPLFGMVGAAVGFACFWKAMCELPRARDRFLLSMGWFALVHGVQLSWMTTMDYMGPFILIVFFFLIFGAGAQFGALSLWIVPGVPIGGRRALAIAGCWVLFEWLRLFFLSGYPWNPIGLALANSSYSLQFAAIWGIYGLSFWVILVNLFALNVNSKKTFAIFTSLALFPYLFGFLYLTGAEKWVTSPGNLSVAVVQTALLPDQKDLDPRSPDRFIPPLNQWERILSSIDRSKKVDLIVFPEAVVPYGAFRPYCHLTWFKELWEERFGKEAVSDLPPLESPLAIFHKGQWRVTNSFIAQAIANHLKTRVIIGLDDQERELRYNAAFHFEPHQRRPQRCEKRVLVPVGEYIPLREWRRISRFIAAQFGIHSSFTPGTEVNVFRSTRSPTLGVSICSEETFSGLTRHLRQKGAELFVNVSNDGWFPNSLLPEQHFEHGRVRAVENGVPIVRSCNLGISSGVDCFGRPVGLLGISEAKADILYFSLPLRTLPTLYSWWGDEAILGISCASLALYFFRRRKESEAIT